MFAPPKPFRDRACEAITEAGQFISEDLGQNSVEDYTIAELGEHENETNSVTPYSRSPELEQLNKKARSQRFPRSI
jgi:hypothetical protein